MRRNEERAITVAAPSYDEMVARARALAPVLRARAREAELLRRLPDETMADLFSSGLFTAFRPARYGGAEVPFRAMIELGAALAVGCGSTSWVYNNLVSHNWLLGYWPPAAQDEIWGADPDALIGSGLVMAEGEVRRVEGGWRVTGRWPFSSGIDPVPWVMLGGRVAGAQGGPPEPHLFLVPRSDYRIIDTWHVMGLAGTGSKDVAMEDGFVPAARGIPFATGNGGPHPGSAVNPGPLYRLPWYPVFSFVTAGTSLGIAQGAVEDFGAAIRSRLSTYSGKAIADLATLQMRLAEAATLVDAAETVMLKDCDEAMATADAAAEFDLVDRARWRRDGAYAAQLAARAVDIVFAGAGGGAIHEDHPLQRALRDVHAANGHIGVSWDLNGGIYGRVALGLEPGFPL
jgi:3-hydroxy-9,10-secoandrosta-1,3,5(10)-triene-9,17-dione monooxygenase